MTVNEFEQVGQHALSSIKGLILRAPEDQLAWRPVETVMPLGQLLAHAAASFTPVVRAAVTGHCQPSPDFDGDTLRSLTPSEAAALVEQQQAELTELLEPLSDEEFQTRPASLPWGPSGSLSFCCLSALDHASGHRYQLFLYLKLLGQPLTTQELFGG